MNVIIEKQNDGTFIAYNTGCDKFTALGTGSTIEEAKADFFNSLDEMKETYKIHGDAVPDEMLEEIRFVRK